MTVEIEGMWNRMRRLSWRWRDLGGNHPHDQLMRCRRPLQSAPVAVAEAQMWKNYVVAEVGRHNAVVLASSPSAVGTGACQLCYHISLYGRTPLATSWWPSTGMGAKQRHRRDGPHRPKSG
jgi:hypothetical protein